MNKKAFYFGCPGDAGHFLYDTNGKSTLWPKSFDATFPWTIGHCDGGLLKNMQIRDEVTGKVGWTCGGDPLWFAFVWHDRSGDSRPGSNSGFYVQGFTHEQRQEAFNYAKAQFPRIIARQRVPLVDP